MEEILVKEVKLNQEEKEALEQLRRILRDTKLPDSVLFTSKFKSKTFFERLATIQENLKEAEKLTSLLLRRFNTS